jgi:phosphate transport system protein
MADSASSMVKNSVTAYFNKDVKLAFSVIKKDDYIDNLHSQILRELITYLAEDIRKTKGAISLMFITRSLERIADHATNIAELVYFMVTGKIIKHTFFDDNDIEELLGESDE